MAGGFSPQLLEEIRARVDIVDLVGQFVNLKRAGENWKGLCPFHAEKTPSFMVHPKKGIFHCFGWGEGAPRYLDSRGIAPEMARRFVLGYAPEGWDHLLGFMKGRGVTEEQLVQVGLVLPRQTGPGVYATVRGRGPLP